MVLLAEDIIQAQTHIFTCIFDKDGWSIKDKFAYNLETLRIDRAGGDTSGRKRFCMYFGTTYRHWKQASC